MLATGAKKAPSSAAENYVFQMEINALIISHLLKIMALIFGQIPLPFELLFCCGGA
jgi:hypothetical protein